MISIKSDTSNARVFHNADFSFLESISADSKDFTDNCGIELKAAVLAAIVAAQDEYVRIIKSHQPDGKLTDEQEDAVDEALFDLYIKDISIKDIKEFRDVLNDI